MSRFLAGVDIGGTKCAVCVADVAGTQPTLLAKRRFPTPPAPGEALIAQQASDLEHFRVFGIYPSFKCSLAKILQLRDRQPEALEHAVWLSVADYGAERIAGRPIDAIVTAGGGTRNHRWLQIKADIYGARISALDSVEATLFGTALLAGVDVQERHLAVYPALCSQLEEVYFP